MRPPEFTGGNPWSAAPSLFRSQPTRFNEAAGIHRRKLRNVRSAARVAEAYCFNEAAGIHRRKLTEILG